MNLKPLVEFCHRHTIIMNYKYDPRFGGGHTFHFMGKFGNGWIKLTRQIFDSELERIGSGLYCHMLLDELNTDFLPRMKEGILNGDYKEILHVEGD